MHRRSPCPPAAIALALAAALALPACGSGDGEGGDGKSGGGGAKKGLTKKLAGPCKTDWISAADKTFPDFTLFSWDTKGQLIEEKSGPAAATVGADIYTKKWAYDAKGTVTAEFFETTGPEPNYDWKYTFDGQGRRATRKGTQTGFGEEDCKYEYYDGKKDHNLLCSYKLTEEITDDEGNVTDTKVTTGKYTIQYIYGQNQIYEEFTLDGSSSPEATTRKFDDAGNLTSIELDPNLQGYPEHITSFEYDSEGRRTKKAIDSDADGTPELVWEYSYDEHGNQLKAEVSVAGKLDRTLVHDYSCW